MQSGVEQEITIVNDKGRLSEGEIENMLQESAKFHEEDSTMRLKVENELVLKASTVKMQSYLSNENFLKNLTQSDKEMIRGLMEDAKQYLVLNKNASAEEIEAKRKQVDDQFMPILRKAIPGMSAVNNPYAENPHVQEQNPEYEMNTMNPQDMYYPDLD